MASEASAKQLCGRVLLYGLLALLLPPLLNHAALQREQTELRTHGQVYDVGFGQKMYLRCEGEGLPTVLLDGPAGASSDLWLLLLAELSQLTRCCVFDRAGLGFSDRPMEAGDLPERAPLPPAYTAERTAADLHRLVTEVSQQPEPLLYLGDGLGALNAQLFAHTYPSLVSDLVLLNPLTEHVLDERGPWLPFVRDHVLPPLQTLHVAAAAGLVRLLLMTGQMEPPLLELADELGDTVINRQKHLMCHPRHASTVVDEHYFLAASGEQLRRAVARPLPANTSVTIVTGEQHDAELPAALNDAWADGAARLQQRYPSARRVTVAGADRQLVHSHRDRLVRLVRQLVRARRDTLSAGGRAAQA